MTERKRTFGACKWLTDKTNYVIHLLKLAAFCKVLVANIS